MRQTGRNSRYFRIKDTTLEHNGYVFIPQVSFCFIFRHTCDLFFLFILCSLTYLIRKVIEKKLLKN